jgi:RNA ligase
VAITRAGVPTGRSGGFLTVVLLDEILDRNALEQQIADGFIARKVHPNAPLTIYDYTQRTQFERVWTPETRASRGLMVHDDGRVWARPFPKFFNSGEHETLPIHEPFEVFEKLDGSLGILYRHPITNEWCVSTRGSFISEQSAHATKLVRARYAAALDRAVAPNETWLFEIIYPENRIVVDYEGLNDLVLLAIIDNETGLDLALPTVDRWPGRVVTLHQSIREWSQIADVENDERSGELGEGYVIRFRSGLRVKVKFADYIRLHRLVTGISTLTVWEHLSEGRSFDELLERVPDEMYKWLTSYVAELHEKYSSIETSCREIMKDARVSIDDRKSTAFFFADQPYRGVLFKMYDNKPYETMIWRMIKPDFAKPFKMADFG